MSFDRSTASFSFWRGKTVFLTGHTGFKGGWLTLWLHFLGARVIGYALEPPTTPNLFSVAALERFAESIIADVRDEECLRNALITARPEIVIHLAAQPLVRSSYRLPVETFDTNVMGTVNLLAAVGQCPGIRAVVNITTDKCYDNQGDGHPLKEHEPLGGYDPYSSSKACSELVTAAWRSSFFNPMEYDRHGLGIATARAGNVIGGGDWSRDRLVPDCIEALLAERPVLIRNPHAIRPWQHVLEPLSGYLLLAQRLYERGGEFSEGWNFGPLASDAKPVEWVVGRLCEKWGANAGYGIVGGDHPHEAACLMLDIAKSGSRLGWRPRFGLDTALDLTVEWVKGYMAGADMAELCRSQIMQYTEAEAVSA